MGIKVNGGLGKITGTATIIRKSGEREEVSIEASASKEAVEKLIAARAAKKDKTRRN